MRWCKARRLKSLPAHPWTVAAYARSLETRFSYAAILKRIRAIARAHLLELAKSQERHPTVRRTLRLIEIRDRFKGQRAALFWPEDFLEKPRTRVKPKPTKSRKLGPAPRLVSRRKP